jgi:hypothetical protein
MSETIDRIGGSLVNVVLGAVILWVGQTTFRHAGQLASNDQKFTSIDQQFVDIDKRYESLRSWLDKVVNNIKDDSRSQFTTDDAEKVVEQIRKLDDFGTKVERRLTDRLTDVEIKLAALESRSPNSQELAALQMEVAQLRATLAQPWSPPATSYQPVSNVAQVQPLYLPPVTTQR